MARLKLCIAYVGKQYSGWQVQACPNKPQPPTIQGFLEAEISRICEERVVVFASGRTDAGVHADAQIAHCTIPDSKSDLNWQLALNTSLPNDIRIVEASIVHDSFHACYDVLKKVYTYSLWLDKKYVPPKEYPFVWACGPLDIEKVDLAISYLVGKHDFASMQNAGTKIKTTERTLFSIEKVFLETEPLKLDLRFEADGFLKQMVRNLTGLIVASGRKKFDPNNIPDLLSICDRRKAPLTAPAKGLTLTQVYYK